MRKWLKVSLASVFVLMAQLQGPVLMQAAAETPEASEASAPAAEDETLAEEDAGAGDGWQDYTYPDARITVRFPEPPSQEKGTYEAYLKEGSRTPVPATYYRQSQGNTHYTLTIADYGGTPAQDPKALYHSVAALRDSGLVAFETRVSIANSSCGYYLGLGEPDGTLSFVALFYNADTNTFYDIRAEVPPEEQAERMSGAIHFQQSLSFLADPEDKPVETVWPQEWTEYDYLSENGFAVRFPVAPVIRHATYRTQGGIEVPATYYQAQSADASYHLTVASYWETDADTTDASDAIDPAVELLIKDRRVLSEGTAGLRTAQCGRELTLANADGSLSDIVVFFPSSQHRLFVLETRRSNAAASTQDTPEANSYFRKSFRLANPQ